MKKHKEKQETGTFWLDQFEAIVNFRRILFCRKTDAKDPNIYYVQQEEITAKNAAQVLLSICYRLSPHHLELDLSKVDEAEDEQFAAFEEESNAIIGEWPFPPVITAFHGNVLYEATLTEPITITSLGVLYSAKRYWVSAEKQKVLVQSLLKEFNRMRNVPGISNDLQFVCDSLGEKGLGLYVSSQDAYENKLKGKPQPKTLAATAGLPFNELSQVVHRDPVEWASLSLKDLSTLKANIEEAINLSATWDLMRMVPGEELTIKKVNKLLRENSDVRLTEDQREKIVQVINFAKEKLNARVLYQGRECSVTFSPESSRASRIRISATGEGSNETLCTRISLPSELRLDK